MILPPFSNAVSNLTVHIFFILATLQPFILPRNFSAFLTDWLRYNLFLHGSLVVLHIHLPFHSTLLIIDFFAIRHPPFGLPTRPSTWKVGECGIVKRHRLQCINLFACHSSCLLSFAVPSSSTIHPSFQLSSETFVLFSIHSITILLWCNYSFERKWGVPPLRV